MKVQLKVLGISMVSSFFIVVMSSVAMAENIEFEGKVVDATYKELLGRACSIKMVSRTPEGDQKVLYKTFPKVEGEKYSAFNRVVPPTRVVYVSALDAPAGALIGHGSKHPHGRVIDISQTLQIKFDATGKKISSWEYQDSWFTPGSFIICR